MYVKPAGVAGASAFDLESGQGELDLLATARTLWRGKWIILLAIIAAVALSLAYVMFLATPLYTAQSVVALQNRQENVVDLESVMSGVGGDQASIMTEVEVLKSRGLIEKVVEELDLTSDPEFNAFIRPRSPYSLGALKDMILGSGEPAPPPTDQMMLDATVDAVIASILVNNIRQSYVFQITVTTQDPEKSARIADTLADLYILDQIEVKFEATEQATKWLTERVSQLKTELQEAENAAKSFNAGTDLISPERLEALNRQLKGFRDRSAEMARALAAQDQRVRELEAARESGEAAAMAAAAGMPGDPQVNGAEGDRAAFERRFDQVLERARFQRDRAVSQLETMQGSIAELEEQVAAQSVDAVKLQQLQREAEASRLIYEYFLGRLKETSVQQGIHQADSRVLSSAVVPLGPSWPRTKLVLAAALVLGFIAGAAIVLLLEMRRSGFRTPEELEQRTGIVTIGQIPRAPSGRRRRILDYVVNKPTSPLVEAIRNLRTSILLANVDRPAKVIMMTSSVPGEGKTTLSLSLAHSIATMGKRVLVIEGDLRRRTFREVFDVKNERGLMTAVAEELPIEDVVYRHETLELDILVGERLKVNAADFFSSDRFARLLAQAREKYDFVVIDTPPVLVVPDARVIAQLADVVVYVVHWDRTPRTQVLQGIHSFATVNVPVNGLVLSQIDPRGMKRYGYTGTYGYGYGASKAYYDA